MKLKNVIFGAVASASMMGASILPVSAASGVSNGSFELGTAPGLFSTEFPGSTHITDWTVVSGTVDYVGTYWQASEGSRSIDMTGQSAGTIRQMVPTVTGGKYMVSFDMSGNPDGGPAVKSMNVEAGGTPETFTYDVVTAGNTDANMKWAPKLFQFTATGTTTPLTFASLDSGFYGPALDNVTVKQYLPISKGDCKKGGWEDFGVFKNQGDCVSYVATGGTNMPAGQ
jgi:choice-of-anchor C domain-containing protein